MLKSLLQPPPLSARASTGLLVVRVIAGLAFVLHGWGKIQHPFSWGGPNSPYPAFLLGLAALSEFGGGIGWMLGLLTPLSCFGIACTMVTAIHLHMVTMKQSFVATGPGEGSYELAAVYLAVAVLLALAGPGRWSADRFLFGQKAV
ncbi:MAG: DoxX family protein [Planctomycetaceae bacterium]|nr:DoxX family protein [Planctomycetaceae bacterium]